MSKRKSNDESVIFLDGKWLESAKNIDGISALVSSLVSGRELASDHLFCFS